MSAPQTVTTVVIFDYILDTSGKAVPNATVHCTLEYNQATVTSPATSIGPIQQTTTTDVNGYYQFTVIANANLVPSGSTYIITTPYNSYVIAVPAGAGPFQATGIIVNVPTLLPTASVIAGPLTITTGPLTVSSNGANITGAVAVTGAETVTGLITGQSGLTISAGSISFPSASLNVSALTGVLPVANGGTGSASQNFVDLTTVQAVGGAKTFSALVTASAGITIVGEAAATDVKATGLTGAANQVRMGGRTSTGAPSSGTWAVGDFVFDGNGVLFVCTAAGTPGTWAASGSAKFADLAPSSGTSQSITVPSGFNAVQLRIRIRNGTTADLGIRFNADSGSNYWWQQTLTTGATNSSTGASATTYIGIVNVSTTSFGGHSTVEINDIAAAQHKMLTATSSRHDEGGSQYASQCGGFWNSTAAITSIQVIVSAGSFASGSSIRAYGLV